jgi:hypothetical protein
VKIPKLANDNLIDRTLALWQPRSRRELNRQDAREILANIRGFFSILREWSRRDNPEPANCIPAAGKADEDSHAGRARAVRPASKVYAREGDANDIFLLGDSHFELIRESARKIGATDPKPERSHG